MNVFKAASGCEDRAATLRCDAGTGHTAACYGRRGFLTGMAALGAGAVFGPKSSVAQTPAVTTKPFRIDIHHHISSPAFIKEIAGRRTGQVPLMKWTPQQSLDDMDQGGVATAILSISEPSVFFGNYDAAIALARESNDYGAKLISDYPGRFGMFGTLPLPDVPGSLREIEYVLDTLKFDGVCMMTDYNGKYLGDPALTPVLEELNRRKAIVYTHPFRNECCRNLVPDVFEPIIELGTDTTRTVASLVFSGTAARFPDIKFIFSHGGGTLPFLIQRFQFLATARKDLQSRIPEGVMHYLQGFYYDTASASTIYPLSSLMKLVPSSHVVFGTDFPFLTAKATAAELRGTGLFSAADLQAIERGNAERLMPKYRT